MLKAIQLAAAINMHSLSADGEMEPDMMHDPEMQSTNVWALSCAIGAQELTCKALQVVQRKHVSIQATPSQP